MKRLAILVILAGLPILAACDEPAPPPSEPAVVAIPEDSHAPAVEDVAAPTAAETSTPPPSTPLPPDERSSAESVQPDSETLFY